MAQSTCSHFMRSHQGLVNFENKSVIEFSIRVSSRRRLTSLGYSFLTKALCGTRTAQIKHHVHVPVLKFPPQPHRRRQYQLKLQFWDGSDSPAPLRTTSQRYCLCALTPPVECSIVSCWPFSVITFRAFAWKMERA